MSITYKKRILIWNYLVDNFDHHKIEKAINALYQEDAEIVRLHYFQNLNLKDISISLNTSIATIRNRHNRGIYKIFKHLGAGKLYTKMIRQIN